MNLKERGVTIGDLLILSILIISTIFIISKVKDSSKQSQAYVNSKEITSSLIAQLS
tara:strand:- start:498 stop:665 length:168 start_codon:yes stop_codon:yes gene_type:complete